MHKYSSNVCKLRQCLDKESKNLACMHTIVTAMLQRQYSQTELTFCITYVYIYIYIYNIQTHTIVTHDMWVPVTLAWRVRRLQLKEQPPIWKVTMNIMHKQLQTPNKGWSTSFWRLGEELTNPHHMNWPWFEMDKIASGLDWSFGTDAAMVKEHEIWYTEF
jgi:hypothetical protein